MNDIGLSVIWKIRECISPFIFSVRAYRAARVIYQDFLLNHGFEQIDRSGESLAIGSTVFGNYETMIGLRRDCAGVST